MLAGVLLEGRFSDDFFAPEYLTNPAMHQMADRVKVTEDPVLTAKFDEFIPSRVEITTRSGEKKVATTEYPRGHHKNPLTDDEVFSKFTGLATRVLPKKRARLAIDQWMQLENCSDLNALFATLHVRERAAS